MGKRRRTLALVVLVCVSVAGLSSAADGSGATSKVTATSSRASNQLPRRLRERLDAAVRLGFRKASTPGAVVGVQTPSGTWATAIGSSNERSKAPMQKNLHQRIGSVTKTFIGALLMQLVGEHKLSLNAKISHYVTGVPDGDRITLRQVADMTSGVASYTAAPAFKVALFSHHERAWRPRELLGFAFPDSPVFDPGSVFQYSDSNYVLLGLVIQKVEGRPIGAVLRKRIIDPLKLAQTSWPGGSASLPKPHAQGYTLQGQSSDKPANATNWNPSYAWASGEMISSVRDLLVYGRALGTGKGLLRQKQQRERLHSFNPKIPPETATLSYGIGLVDDRGWVGHTGSVPGYTTAVYYHPGIDATVVVEANSDIVSGSCPAQPTLIDDPITRPCATPADRIMGAVAASLRHPYQLPPG
jgi:D-alanyl-D-alanine carboxypeptidase